jgi:hypothetical protein
LRRLLVVRKPISRGILAVVGAAPGRRIGFNLSRVKYLFERYAAIITAGQMNLSLSDPAKAKRGAARR